MKKIVLIGAGARGFNSYTCQLLDNDYDLEVIAVVEPNDYRRNKAAETHKIDKKFTFSCEDDFYKLGKIADGVIIANQDKDHFYSAINCMELGYDILLEKPISTSKKELLKLEEKAKETNVRVMVCHVLRYTPFFTKIKELVDSNAVGRIVGIDHVENIGNHHMGHSFVRGHWKNEDDSAPIILAKSCHDLDILNWLIGCEYKSIQSRGKLNYFIEENAPEESTEKCKDCPLIDNCVYSAKKFYLDRLPGGWMPHVTSDISKENVERILSDTTYGTCIYKCGNDVCDHQVTTIEYENDVICTFTLTAFTNQCYRKTIIYGDKGTIEANELLNEIKVSHFKNNWNDEEEIIVYHPEQLGGGHSGGDKVLFKDYVNFMNNRNYKVKTSLSQSIQSHIMAYDAEVSRKKNGEIILKNQKENI